MNIRNVKDKIKLEVIIEKDKSHFWGRIEEKGFMPTGQGKTVAKLLKNIMMSIEVKISSIAKRAKLNESLVRQYASGNKFPSVDQAKKIELALHNLGKRLNNVTLFAV